MRRYVFFLLILVSMVAFSFDAKSIIIVPEKPYFTVDVWLNKPEGSVYEVGERMEIFVKSSKDAYILVYDINAQGKVTLIFPNKYESDNFVRANEIKKIPSKSTYSLRVSPPYGKEYIQVIASARPIPIFNQLKELGTAQAFPTLSDNVEEYVQNKLKPYLSDEWVSDLTYFYVGRAPAFGTLIVDSTPPGMTVYIDGSYKGKTPVTVSVDEGTHYVTVYFENYTFYKEVYVERDKTVKVTATLPLAQLSLSSSPSGASVYLNGVYQGKTPLTLNLSPGNYTVTFRKEGYREETRNITLSAGETRSVYVALKPSQSSLKLRTDPSGVDVYINGRYVGTTDQNGLNLILDPGTYEIKLEKEGYETDRFTVNLAPGEEKEIFRRLERKVVFSEVRIETDPSRAAIYLNGYYHGETPITLYVQVGTYEITIVKPGYRTIVKTITFDDEEEYFKFIMNKIE
ncbi:PEGA domain-containing protein [Thermotoga sp. Mc24]|uniref:PEGA domain-containing protein n=1 Tax=Thermotoga sp. Mc24 TaxID=1231241 RepID=UPI000542C5A5|nr:PEGA domain-containing protein [Thermotoga sp. Mc24]KHC90713.1 PEGA domain-containing protein [Thermotoga sp. Mc24]